MKKKKLNKLIGLKKKTQKKTKIKTTNLMFIHLFSTTVRSFGMLFSEFRQNIFLITRALQLNCVFKQIPKWNTTHSMCRRYQTQ